MHYSSFLAYRVTCSSMCSMAEQLVSARKLVGLVAVWKDLNFEGMFFDKFVLRVCKPKREVAKM